MSRHGGPHHNANMPEELPLNRPKSKTDLFLSFTFLALQGFGGVLAVVQRELVERKRWMTPAQFVEDWAVAQILPGPNVINFCLMIGGRYFGLAGALAALAGRRPARCNAAARRLGRGNRAGRCRLSRHP